MGQMATSVSQQLKQQLENLPGEAFIAMGRSRPHAFQEY
jgi:hypothetical protein